MEGEIGITHFLIHAKQTIRFNEKESEKLRDEIFTILKDFNCFIYSNLKGVDIFEEDKIETNNYNDPRIEKIRNELSDKVVESTTNAYNLLQESLN